MTSLNPPVVLTKRQGVSLVKPQGGYQPGDKLRVNLNWTRQASTGWLHSAFGGGRNAALDLDLGALTDVDGDRDVVQALGNDFGCLDQPPFVQLMGDDRSGDNQDGENLLFNLHAISRHRAIYVPFAYIYEGAPRFGAANGIVTIQQPHGPDLIINLAEETAGSSRMCGLAVIESDDQGNVSVQREARFISGMHRALDQAYRWGLNWTSSRK